MEFVEAIAMSPASIDGHYGMGLAFNQGDKLTAKKHLSDPLGLSPDALTTKEIEALLKKSGLSCS